MDRHFVFVIAHARAFRLFVARAFATQARLALQVIRRDVRYDR